MRIIGVILIFIVMVTSAQAQPVPCNGPKVISYIKNLLIADWQWNDGNDWTPTKVDLNEDTIATLDTNGLIRMCAASIKGFGPEDPKTNQTFPDGRGIGKGGIRPDAEYDHDIYYRLVPSDNQKSFWIDFIDKDDTIRKP